MNNNDCVQEMRASYNNLMEKVDALYVRVSTDQQVERGESIETQKSRLLQYAKDKGLKPHVYEDAGYSAGDTNRPAYKKLIADIKTGKVESVTVTKLDRISRNLQDAVDLIYNTLDEHNVSLRALDQQFDTATPMGKFMINLLVTVAQWEREMISERVRIDMHHRAGNGKWNGGPVPFGYTTYNLEAKRLQEKGSIKEDSFQKAKAICPIDKMLYPHPEQALLVKKIFEMYIECKSQRSVTHWLNTKGYKTARGETWASSTVSRILRNSVYMGKMVYGKRISTKTSKKIKKRKEEEWVKADGVHEPIISEAMFKKAQQILESQATEPVRVKSEYLFSGILRCGKCNGKMHGMHSARNGHAWSYYRCTNHVQKGNSVCEGNLIEQDKIEKAVIDKLLVAHEGQEMVKLEKAIQLFNKKIHHKDVPLKEEKEKLERENKKILQNKDVLIRRLEDETIKNDDYKRRSNELDGTYKKNTLRIQVINDQLNDLGIQEVSFQSVYSILNEFPRRWKHTDFQGRRTLLSSILRSITYTDSDKEVDVEIYYLGESKVDVTCVQSVMDSWHTQ